MIFKDINDEKNIVRNLKEIFEYELKGNDRKGAYAKTQKMLAYNSNKIEGSTLTSEQTASLFDTGTLYAYKDTVYRSKDIEEMTGHFNMFNYMLKCIDEPLTEDMIKKFHYHLKVGVFEDMANGFPIGEYKNRANIVSDIQTSKPTDVSTRLNDLLDDYCRTNLKLSDLARFHAEYEKIHPFQDGNGRTGRIILFKQCLNSGIIPIVIKDENKMEYYNALHLAQTESNYVKLEKLFEEYQISYYEEIKDFIYELPKIINNMDTIINKQFDRESQDNCLNDIEI